MEPFTADEPIAQPSQPEPVPMNRRVRLIIELILLLILMGGILALTSNKVQFEQVVSPSMVPTLMVGDTIMTDANAAPHRYDIVCFNDVDKNSDDRLVKRVIGLPGDTIDIQDGILSINGQEEYSKQIPDNKMDTPDLHLRVPADRIFVMGDNRNNSEDSRFFGPVPYGNVTGVVTLIVWPPSHWGRPQKLH